MGIKMNTYAGGQMTAGNDAILHDRAIANTGILHGCNITFMGANQVHIEKGYLLIKGRYCTVTEDTIQVAMSNSETELPGRLYVRADLADAQEPVKILSVAADPLPKLTQDENFNYDNGVWEMELATYTAGMTAIKDLTVTCEEVPEGASKKETAALLGKIDELTEKIESTDITQERLVGKFYGKNVYEKVIDRHINIPISTNFQIFNIPHGIENFESIISINIMADGYTLPFLRDDGYLTTYIFMVNNTNIVLYNRTDWNNNFRITLRYTKSK